MDTCYKFGMQGFRDENEPKNTVDLPVKVSQPVKDELKIIGRREDRPLGYVARELMLRGLAAYKRDGVLKERAVEGRNIEFDSPMITIPLSTATPRRKKTQGNRKRG